MVAELIVHRKSHFLKIQAKSRPPGEVQDCKTRLKLTSCFDTHLVMHIIFYVNSSKDNSQYNFFSIRKLSCRKSEPKSTSEIESNKVLIFI